ncbi:MAG: hypothetical protein EPN40_09775 [Rhodanobacteraceae bacterium]|nr:MAG: hypothetical protein EPN40_09775 [Rhodanobacteraceae bacterium]
MHEPIRRGIALGVAISFHIAVLMLVLRPAISEPGAAVDRRSNHHALQLRLLRWQISPAVHRAMPARLVIAPAMHAHAKPAARPLQTATRQAAPVSAQLPDVPSAATVAPGLQSTIDDGGFHERLLKAQHAYAVHGVPGSDTPVVAGIHLIDPHAQGIGAAVRQLQRLFGIASRHCIDVDVWRHLTPRELSARHISPDEVDRVDHENHCNQPAGLNF